MGNWVVLLNITVSSVLFFLMLPTVLNWREKIGIRICIAVIYFTVIFTCIFNLLLQYYKMHNLVFIGMPFMCFPFLFGPAIYYYVRFSNGDFRLNRLYLHFIPAVILLLIVFYLALTITGDHEKKYYLNKLIAGELHFYNILNYFTIISPIIYAFFTLKWIKKLKFSPDDPMLRLKEMKRDWTREFTNYFLYNMVIFTIILFIINLLFRLPQIYTDLIGMPAFMLIVYGLLMVKIMMNNNDVEILYTLTKVEHQRKLFEQRAVISRDLHDNIGAYANSLIYKINYLSKNPHPKPQEFEDVRENAQKILGLLRQTIWVLNNDNATVESLYDHFKNYAVKTFRNTPFKLRLEEEITKNRILSAEASIHIFRILQELLQNCMKHSQGDLIEVKVVSADFIKITVKDNGTGFDPDEQTEGFGLNNIRKRANQMGYNVEIQSEKGKGTLVEITENTANHVLS